MGISLTASFKSLSLSRVPGPNSLMKEHASSMEQYDKELSSGFIKLFTLQFGGADT